MPGLAFFLRYCSVQAVVYVVQGRAKEGVFGALALTSKLPLIPDQLEGVLFYSEGSLENWALGAGNIKGSCNCCVYVCAALIYALLIVEL